MKALSEIKRRTILMTAHLNSNKAEIERLKAEIEYLEKKNVELERDIADDKLAKDAINEARAKRNK